MQSSDLEALILNYMNDISPVKHHIQSFNEFITVGLPHIGKNIFAIDRTVKNDRNQTLFDRKWKSTRIKVKFIQLEVGDPIYSTLAGQTQILYPSVCRNNLSSYVAPLSIGAKITFIAQLENDRIEKKKVYIPMIQFSSVPIMVRSIKCSTYDESKSILFNMNEDPYDIGGYFIINGQEWVIDALENIKFNSPHLRKHMTDREIVRCEFISQSGGAFENSSQIIIKYMKDGMINIVIRSTKFVEMEIPFYIIYRLFGMTSDKDITETIIFENDNTLSRQMKYIIENAFHVSAGEFARIQYVTNHVQVVTEVAEILATKAPKKSSYQLMDNVVRNLNTNLLSSMDNIFIPHMGLNQSDRLKKIKFLGLLIRKTILVSLEMINESDRDSYSRKRVYTAGVSLAKMFKSMFNSTVVSPIKRNLIRLIVDNSFEKIRDEQIVNEFRNAIQQSKLGKSLETAITTGNKAEDSTLGRQNAFKRISSQLMERKNQLHVISTIRNITTHSMLNTAKQSARSDQMRRVHPSFTGFICPIQSAETGTPVGMKKQMALSCSVTNSDDEFIFKEFLLRDPDIIKLNDIVTHMTNIFVNGEWIGCCQKPILLVNKYKEYRRKGQHISKYTSIIWDPVSDDIQFWLDLGRLYRPLLIVYNNIDEYDKAINDGGHIEFSQYIKITPAHIKKLRINEIKIDDLVAEGIVEYITPDEQEQCLIAPSLDKLMSHSNDVVQRYTHCDIAISQCGYAALMSILGNYTQPVRSTLVTAQTRHAGGWYSMNAPHRLDINRYMQYSTETPLIPTITNQMVMSNGSNIIMAYMCTGDNQEDSTELNKASCDRGLFAGTFYKVHKIIVEPDEIIQTPIPHLTKHIRAGASYGNLIDGIIAVGSIVTKGTVLVSKLSRLPESDKSEYQYEDRSVVYKKSEPVCVIAVLRPTNGKSFCIIKISSYRIIAIGDKMSSRSGCKTIVAKRRRQSDMPFTESGMTPDIIINPHSVPTRMVIGQIIENVMSSIAAKKGIVPDGTMFRNINQYEISNELLKYGFRANGKVRMFNGKSGDWFDTAIYIGPSFQQRLQKFIIDDTILTGDVCSTDAITGLPVGSSAGGGGLRIGEYGAWVLESHGAMINLMEKFHDDGDGRPLYICKTCGHVAIYNATYNKHICNICRDMSEIYRVESTRTANIILNELEASNIDVTFKLQPIQSW